MKPKVEKEQYNLKIFWQRVIQVCFTDKIPRLSRWEYWNSTLAVLIVPVAVIGAISWLIPDFKNDNPLFPMIFLIPYAIFLILFYFESNIYRLHDTGHSGWYLLVGGIPFVGGIILFLWFVCHGDLEKNKYGDPPKKFIKPPFYKRWWFWCVLYCALVAIFARII